QHTVDLGIAGVLKMTTTAGPTDAIELGLLHASGGDVRIQGASINGSGSVTAQGSPQIAVDNASSAYLRLNETTVGKTGGKVIFTGAATSARGVSIDRSADDALMPQVSISNTWDDPVKNAGESITQGPAIFLQGPLANQGGRVSISNRTGSIGLFAPLSALEVEMVAPNGAVAIYLPKGVYHAGGDPVALWGGGPQYNSPYFGNPIALLYNNDGTPIDRDIVIERIVNLMYLQGEFSAQYLGRSPTNSEEFTKILMNQPQLDNVPVDLGQADGDTISNWMFFGQCALYLGDAADCRDHVEAAQLSSLYDELGENAYARTQKQQSGASGAFPLVEWFGWRGGDRTWEMQDYPDYVLDHAAASSLRAQLIVIDAKTVDINGKIEAGSPVDVDIKLADARNDLDDWNSAEQSGNVILKDGTKVFYTSNLPEIYGVPLEQDSSKNVVKLSAIRATGGGMVSIKGDIISTSPTGEISISDGYGHVSVENLGTSILRVQDVNTGNSAEGVIKITDTSKQVVVGGQSIAETRWYVHDPATDTIRIYDNRNGATALEDARLGSSVFMDHTAYHPTQNRRFEWERRVYLKRDIPTAVASDSEGHFAEAPWLYVDADGNRVGAGDEPVYILSRAEVVDGHRSDPVFRESISGSAAYG
ncbi:MAG: hypothetical protein L0H29_09060, partial [Sinobacteraceae bacterium]|nr:hypothetical protein [Nevskiaceae bacterium]